MTILVVALSGCALALPGLRPNFALRGNPVWLARLSALALVLGLGGLVVGLGITATVGAVAAVVGAPATRAAEHLAPGGSVLAAVAALALLVLAVRALRAARRIHRLGRAAHADAWLGRHEHRGDHELVVLPAADAVAYSVPGRLPQVVVSQGLLDEFDAPLVEFVLAHERAHLRRHDHRLLRVAALADALVGMAPPVTRSTAMLRLAVERAADEEAARGAMTARLDGALALDRLALTRAADAAVASYRARQLSTAPLGVRSTSVVAAAGLAVVAFGVAATTGHVGTDLPGLFALLH